MKETAFFGLFRVKTPPRRASNSTGYLSVPERRWQYFWENLRFTTDVNVYTAINDLFRRILGLNLFPIWSLNLMSHMHLEPIELKSELENSH